VLESNICMTMLNQGVLEEPICKRGRSVLYEIFVKEKYTELSEEGRGGYRGVDRVNIHPPFFSKKNNLMSLYLK